MEGRGDEWQWSWTDVGKEKHLDRVFHKKVRAYRASDGRSRVYKVGDTVVMRGENEDTWIAQIIELFHVNEDDEELCEVLQMDLRKINNPKHYELMRVTLRWFYNPSDMNMHTLRSSSCPNHIKNEIYFSDHVEKEGYNDITVIEGKAWLVPSKRRREEFLQNPPEDYERGMDQVRIVRCFVNSLSSELAVRELDTGELNYLLKNPTADKELFDTSRQRMRGLINANGTVMQPPSKGTGSKQPGRRRRTIREEVDVEDDEFDPNVVAGKSEPEVELVHETAKRSASRDKKERRKKHGSKRSLAAQSGTDPIDMQSLKQANEEVLDMVALLNQSALPVADSAPALGEAGGDDDDGVIPLGIKNALAKSGAQHLSASSKSVATGSTARQAMNANETIVRDVHSTGKERKKRRQPVDGQEPVEPSGSIAQLDNHSSFMSNDTKGSKGTSSNVKGSMVTSGGLGSEQLDRMRGSGSYVATERSADRRAGLKDDRGGSSRSIQEKSAHRDSKKLAAKDISRKATDGTFVKARDDSTEEKNGKRVLPGELAAMQKDPKKVRLSDDASGKRESKKPRLKEGKMKRTDVTSNAVTTSDGAQNEKDVDWWEETQKVLKQLEVQFKSMSSAEQELFRSHVDLAFDMAVSKVTQRGLFGNIDPNNEELMTITKEIMDELARVMSEKANTEVCPMTGMQGGSSRAIDSVD